MPDTSVRRYLAHRVARVLARRPVRQPTSRANEPFATHQMVAWRAGSGANSGSGAARSPPRSVETTVRWKADGLVVARGRGHVLVATGGEHNRVGNIKPALVVIERAAHAAPIHAINHERDPEDRPLALIDAREIGEQNLALSLQPVGHFVQEIRAHFGAGGQIDD